MAEKNVQTLDRAFDIIELLSTAREGMGVTEIGMQLGLHKSTVHRLLNALAERGYIEKNVKTGTYKLGLKFIEISSLSLNKLELKTEALPYLRRLAELVGQPVHLAILSGREAVYIEKVEAQNSIRMYSQIGKRVPVYCSAIGKVLLSGMGDDELEDTLEGIEFDRYTENTIKTREELLENVRKVRQFGWAVDNEEHEPGIRCIAAPVYDYTGRVIAAISVSGDKRIITNDRDEETSGLVLGIAAEVSHRMGYVKSVESQQWRGESLEFKV